MKILLIGGGGREHAIAWKLAQSDRVTQIFVAPGNGGTATLEKAQNVEIAADQIADLRDFAVAQQVELTVVGPEVPLVAGVVDLFAASGLKVFGPTQAAAQLEGSKAFSKAFMLRHKIPTARSETFDEFDAAIRHLRTRAHLPVIKASGLAAGKGVILPNSLEEAAQTLQEVMLDKRFGDAGDVVLIEERLMGPELSVLAFCDGKNLRIMPPAQDHKRLEDGDRGPNTGGMGAFTPSPMMTPQLLAEVEAKILRPALDGMAADGMPYVGVLYAGLMLTKRGPRVIEFNCRFGDPEAQVVIPLLESDLVEILLACVDGTLDSVEPVWRATAGATVVMASGGYPGAYTKGVEIYGVEAANAGDCVVFQAGTKLKDGRLLTDGGRVLAVTVLDGKLSKAVQKAYAGVRQITFSNAVYRSDIGRRSPHAAQHARTARGTSGRKRGGSMNRGRKSRKKRSR